MGCLVALTCIYIGYIIWTRRHTLFGPTEREKLTHRTLTMSLLMQMLALVLMSPQSSATVGRALHGIFNQWNLDTWAGHGCYLGSAGLFALNVGSRLNLTDAQLHAVFKQWFERPITVVMPILLALIVKSPGADTEIFDLYNASTDYWLDTYWTALCAYLILVISQIARALLIVRRDPRSRRTADIYVAACVAAIAVCVIRIFSTWHDDNWREGFWAINCLAAILMAYGAGQAWRRRRGRTATADPRRY